MPAVTPRTPGPKNVEFQQFCDRLRTDLPGDSHGRGSFDTSARFVAGDPGAKFGATAPLEYETTGETGHPHWELIFEYILHQCGYLVEFHTVYVMVDNRNLANHRRQDPSLPHWPAAARWWHSRLKLIGPHKEKTELLLFPISATTGLHHVHPRSYVPGHRSSARLPETSHYACVWGCQDWYGKIPCLDCTRRMAPYGCCHARNSEQTTYVGQCWAPSSCRYNH